MSIHIILGKPGSGKSLYATSRVITELVEGNRNVVTNLPLRPDALNEYLNKRYPNVNCRMVERLRILNDDEIREFWKYRGPAMRSDEAAGHLELGEAPHGVAYFLDEAHIAFNARDWATLGRGAIHYMSQHRKLGDIVWPITQSPGNLDKQFRSVAEDFTVMRNEYTARFGPFRGRGRFVRKTYLQEPGNNSEPFETATFTLDVKGVAACYDTAKGIGVHGNKADIGRRAKGIPIWVVVPAACVVGLMCVAIPYAMGKGASKFITGKGGSAVSGVDAALHPGRKADIPASPGRKADIAPAPEVVASSWVSDTRPERVLWVNGMLWGRNGFRVLLSDGRILDRTDPLLSLVDSVGVVYAGKRIYMKPGREMLSPRAEGIGTAPAVALGSDRGTETKGMESAPTSGQ